MTNERLATAVSHPSAASTSRYLGVRRLTEELARPLSAEDQTAQSMADASPTKWHRAHTTWFFESFVLRDHHPHYRLVDPAYTYLFNSYYEAVGARHPRPCRGLITRPGIEEVARYRHHVDAAMLSLLDGDHLDDAVAGLVELGLNHEQQHQELLLMDIKHLLSCNPALPSYRDLAGPGMGGSMPLSQWVDHPGGLVEIGHPGSGHPVSGFAFDSESPRHRVHLRPFAIATQPVTNGEWIGFIEDGGYSRPDLWLSDGWAMLHEKDWEAPQYWSRDSNSWALFTLGGPRRVHPTEPVCHVSYYEADAFARWAGARLPTEAEWEVVAACRPDGGALLDLELCHPKPVLPTNRSFVGDVWQWTSSSYAPYPGFQPAPGAVGEYNGKFMVSQYVLRGGSCVTPPGHCRVTYRNFFPPSARWCFSGLRLARDI